MNTSGSRPVRLAWARLAVSGLLVALASLPGPVVADELEGVLWDFDPTIPMPVFIPEWALVEFQRTYPALWENFLVPRARRAASVRCGDTSMRIPTGPPSSGSRSLDEVLAAADFVGTGVVRSVSSGWGGRPVTVAYVELTSTSAATILSHPCAPDACGAKVGELLPVRFTFGKVAIPGIGEVCVNEPDTSLAMPRPDEELLFVGYLQRAGSPPYRFLDVAYWWVRPSDFDDFTPQPFAAIRDRTPVSHAFVSEALRHRTEPRAER